MGDEAEKTASAGAGGGAGGGGAVSSSSLEPGCAAAQELKELGNKEYKSGAYLKAAGLYSRAIKLDSKNHVLYSNRCAALLQLSKITKALQDAEEAIRLKPDWGKGYYRRATALEGAGRLDDALDAYKEAAALEPNNSEFSTKVKNISRQIRARAKPKAPAAAAAAVTASASASAKSDTGNSGANGGAVIRDDDEYAAAIAEHKKNTAKTKEVAYNDQRVYAWGRAKLDETMALFVERGGRLDAAALFLSGKAGAEADGSDGDAQVNIKQAFESPDTLSNCVEFLRKYADDMCMHAATVIVPRAAISYPQVWKGLGAKQWKHGDCDGFFVQLESRSDRRVWFVPTQTRKGAAIPKPTEYHSLDPEVYRLVPALFR